MMKKKVLIVVVILILFGFWLFRTQTLMDIAKPDRETAHIGSVVVMEEYGNRRAEFENKETIEALFEMLENTEVRFDGWWINTIRTDGGELLYHLRFYHEEWLPSSRMLFFCTNGQVYYDHSIYKLQGEDMQKCTDTLERILQEYEVIE